MGGGGRGRQKKGKLIKYLLFIFVPHLLNFQQEPTEGGVQSIRQMPLEINSGVDIAR